MKKTRISELAEVATCQRRVYLKAKLGLMETATQRLAKAQGTAVHERAFKQRSPEDTRQDRRCFIATAVYGEDAWQTSKLRRFRDEHLLGIAGGRLIVRCYYKVSPWIAGVLSRSKSMKAIAKWTLDLAVGKKESP